MRPLSLADCLNIALQQNGTILKARNDLDAQYGMVVQTRAVALPQLQATGQYKDTDRSAIEIIPFRHQRNLSAAKSKLERGRSNCSIHL